MLDELKKISLSVVEIRVHVTVPLFSKTVGIKKSCGILLVPSHGFILCDKMAGLLDGLSKIEVEFSDGRIVPGIRIFVDRYTRMAIIHVRPEHINEAIPAIAYEWLTEKSESLKPRTYHLLGFDSDFGSISESDICLEDALKTNYQGSNDFKEFIKKGATGLPIISLPSGELSGFYVNRQLQTNSNTPENSDLQIGITGKCVNVLLAGFYNENFPQMGLSPFEVERYQFENHELVLISNIFESQLINKDKMPALMLISKVIGKIKGDESDNVTYKPDYDSLLEYFRLCWEDLVIEALDENCRKYTLKFTSKKLISPLDTDLYFFGSGEFNLILEYKLLELDYNSHYFDQPNIRVRNLLMLGTKSLDGFQDLDIIEDINGAPITNMELIFREFNACAKLNKACNVKVARGNYNAFSVNIIIPPKQVIVLASNMNTMRLWEIK